MSQGAYINLVGFVAQDPTIRATRTGKVLTKLRVGTTPRFKNAEGVWQDGDTSYYDIACWGRLAHHVKQSMHKGEPVTLKGRFRLSSFEDRDGNQRTAVEITADTVGHDLNRGTATYLRLPPIDVPGLGGQRTPVPGDQELPDPADDIMDDELADMMDDEAIDRLSAGDMDAGELAMPPMDGMADDDSTAGNIPPVPAASF